MALVAIYDACVLYPAPLRDLLIRVAQTGIVGARWTDRILDECFRSILEKRPELQSGALARTRELMTRAVADCIVQSYEHLIDGLSLPDPDDRHVLAAAIHVGAHVIVTFNLRDFPPEALAAHQIEALHPDDFVLELIDLAPTAVLRALGAQVAALKRPPMTASEVLNVLHNTGLVQSVQRLREMLGDGTCGPADVE